jgi:spermidine/putrescine transport system substrate-binding protein
MYVGGEPCTTDKEAWRKARDVLVAAKPKWIAMNYGTVDTFAKGDFLANAGWNGATFRARLKNPAIKFGFPKEGFPVWMDSVAVLADAKNVENAKLFQNFIMDPENAALISAFARYSNGIMGSEPFMPADMQGAPELTLPEGNNGVFIQACPPEVNELMTRIWTDLQK